MSRTKTRAQSGQSRPKAPQRAARASAQKAPSGGPSFITELASAVRQRLRASRGLGSVICGVVLALLIYIPALGFLRSATLWSVRVFIGQAALILPLALILLGAQRLLTPDEEVMRLRRGVIISTLSLLALTDVAFRVVDEGSSSGLFDGGGAIGLLLSFPLRAFLPEVVAFLLLTIAAMVGMWFIAGDNLAGLSARVGRALEWVKDYLLDAFRPGYERDNEAEAAERYEPTPVEPSAPEPVRAPRQPAPDRPPLPSLQERLAGNEIDVTLPETSSLDDVAFSEPRQQGEWILPSLGVLRTGKSKPIDRRLVEQSGQTLESALHEHGVDARLVGMTVGPTVTRYELELAPGVKVNRVTSLSNDIAYAMASPDVRILAPIPGRSAIGVEVPNAQRQLVSLGDILRSQEAQEADHPLEVGMGRGISGKAVMTNIATMPHVLIAGQTGAGKSSCINSLITSLLMRTTPDEVRLILIDPKRVELGQYNGLPHLLTQVVTDPKKAANALEWAVREMERRYEVLASVGQRDITGYNDAFDRGDFEDRIEGEYRRFPYIVLVVDELNDLMMVAARDVEASICRIAQMARAVGIHLVIATQRPSVNVITGVIKANVPSRMAFAVSSIADSRVILDQAGAEKLIGQGDMLMTTASSSRAQRIQGAWIDEEDIRKVVEHWQNQMEAEPEYVEAVVEGGAAAADTSGFGDGLDEEDDLLSQAMELVVRSQLGSTSMLQRKLRVGFARAGRLMDLLEQRGVVGPSEGSKARNVLMTVDELEGRMTTV